MPGAIIEQQHANRMHVNGRDLVAFAGCNYLGLAHDPRVLEAVRDATGRYGLSTSASRETSGNTPAHQELESRIASFLAGDGTHGTAGLLVPDGYTANLAAAQVLAASHHTAVIDARAHASLGDAARCAGMDVRFFGHMDADDLSRELASVHGPALVMTDGVFTADGAVAPVRSIMSVLRDGDRLLIDDCHAFAVLGGGRGLCAQLGIDLQSERDRIVVTTTLAKGLGGGGGVVVGDAGLIESARRCAHAYVCTTPVSPIVACGTLAAFEILRSEPERVERLARNAGLLRLGMHAEPDGDPALPVPICARPVTDAESGERIAAILRERGVFVPLMAYPGGPSPWYLRASVTSEHTARDIELLGAAIEELV